MDELRYQIDLLKAMNQKLTKSEKMYRMVAESSNDTFMYYNEETKEFSVFGKWDDFFSFQMKEPQDFLQLFDQMDPAYEEAMKVSLFPERHGKDHDSIECLTKDKRKWYKFSTSIVFNEDHTCSTDKIITISDITKYKKQNEELTYLAYYDIDTGLYNRNYFISKLSEMLREAKEQSEVVSVMMVDIDDFHKFNDTLGMIAGDEIVQVFGGFLKELTNDKVMACHLNRDVYCLAIRNPNRLCNAETIHAAISKRLQSPLVVNGVQEVHITVSLGVADFPEAASNALELINCSEVVMLRTKSLGKNGIQYFENPIMDDFMDAVEIETKMKDAFYSGKFQMYYQPQYSADSQQLRGMEALIRWKNEDGRFVSPAVFIPIAEKNGSIIPIGNWVIEESVRQYAKWKKKYGIKKIMSINVSARQYSQEDFVPHFLKTLRENDVDPTEIEIEVTESILIEDFDMVMEKLCELKRHGIRISLDDFGTGFSSLSYLKKMPIDTLKIDKSFIDTVLTDSATRIITESIVDMVKSLGFESVAEGVEIDKQYDYLNDIGCDVIQGYLFSKPLPAEEMEKLF